MLKTFVAGLALTVSTIASAEIITQTDWNNGDAGGFQGFDSSLGALQSVTLTISDWERRLYSTNLSEGQTIEWETDGEALFSFYILDNLVDVFEVPITGSGTLTEDGGYFDVSGSGTFNIAPGLIPEQWIDGTTPLVTFIRFGGPGFYDFSDTTFTGGSVSPSFCGSNSCTNQQYTLTYSYRPFNNHAVPEPATWAMMLLGFGFAGASLRRHRAMRVTGGSGRPPVTALAWHPRQQSTN